MILKQYYLGCLAHASYLVADEESRVAAVVDPQRDVDQYLADAEAQGPRRSATCSSPTSTPTSSPGTSSCATVCGAEIVHRRDGGGGVRALRTLATATRSTLGPQVRLEVLETPGHTPESISILVYDAEHGEQPYAVLTGDTLFIGDVGRPDLRAALGWTRRGARRAALRLAPASKLLPLPDETLVYPAHGAGSLCGKNLSTDTVSTIGVQRQYNYALQPMTKDEFVRIVTADQPDTPAYFTYDAVLNTKERPTLEEALERELKPLALDEVIERCATRARQVLDTREPAEFAGAHLARIASTSASAGATRPGAGRCSIPRGRS